jgi:hypothetical protein
MRRLLPLVLCLLALPALAGDAPEPPPDVWAEALGLAGRTEAELGYEPKGWWPRYPRPGEPGLPYVLPAFDDLLAEPVRVHDHARFLGDAAQSWLAQERGKNGLARGLYHLGVDRMTSGFRAYWMGYCEFCEASAEGETPLADALAALGAEQTAGPKLKRAKLDLATRRVLAELLLDLAVAHHWVELSFRNVDPATRTAVAAVHDLEETQADGQVYHHAFDDLMRDWDLPSFLTGAQVAVNGVDRAGLMLTTGIDDPAGWTGADLAWSSPLGTIRIARDCEVSTFGGDPGLAAIDLAGCDSTWNGGAAASPTRPISVAIDVGGADRYGPDAPPHANATDDAPPPVPAFGAGLTGVGVLWDGAGDDRYAVDEQGLGFAQAGVGVLFDRLGADEYVAHHMAQGAAWFGIGMLVDEGGDDRYRSITSSQASAGAFGLASLVDVDGDDHYYVEPEAQVAGLGGDYHSGSHILGNASQGTAMGRRGDLTDGHSWAGGQAMLIDLAGDDRYEGGNWVQGVGYWYGIGLLIDRGGDDTYSSVYFSTASGAHYAIGGLFDTGGDDVYTMQGDPSREGVVGGAGLGFGWDYVVAMLVDVGGDDSYSAELLAMGCAEIRSVAILADIGGDDRYAFPQGSDCGVGASDRRDSYLDPNHANSHNDTDGLFIDVGGADTYLDYYDVAERKTLPSTRWKDDSDWSWQQIDDEARAHRSYAVGIDRAEGAFWGHEPAASAP